MKFAIAALLATTSAMRIEAQADGMPMSTSTGTAGGMSTTTTSQKVKDYLGCGSDMRSDMPDVGKCENADACCGTFTQVSGVSNMSRSIHICIPPGTKQGDGMSIPLQTGVTPGDLPYGLGFAENTCPAADPPSTETTSLSTGKCISKELAQLEFRHLDTNHNEVLSYDEIKVGIENFAKSAKHTMTQEEWGWIKETGSKIDSKTPGKVDEEEFFEFTNAVSEHFNLCHLGEEIKTKLNSEFDNTKSVRVGGGTYITAINKSNHYVTMYHLDLETGKQVVGSHISPNGQKRRQNSYVGDKWFIRAGKYDDNGQILSRIYALTGEKTYEIQGKQCDKVYVLPPPPTIGSFTMSESSGNEFSGKNFDVLRDSMGEITGIYGPGTDDKFFLKVKDFSIKLKWQYNTWGKFQALSPSDPYDYVTIVKRGDDYQWITNEKGWSNTKYMMKIATYIGANPQKQEFSDACY